MNHPDGKPRCHWPGKDPLYIAYHDQEWGVPEHDPRALWEKLVLDGFQAGLSWITILKKRDAFRRAFADFDPDRVAKYTGDDVERLMQDASIVRSRVKILATVGNACAYQAMAERGENFDAFIWSFQVQPVRSTDAAPVDTPQSQALSKALKARGFKFCGPVIVYAFMQAVGVVNDHSPNCFRYKELGGITPE